MLIVNRVYYFEMDKVHHDQFHLLEVYDHMQVILIDFSQNKNQLCLLLNLVHPIPLHVVLYDPLELELYIIPFGLLEPIHIVSCLFLSE